MRSKSRQSLILNSGIPLIALKVLSSYKSRYLIISRLHSNSKYKRGIRYTQFYLNIWDTANKKPLFNEQGFNFGPLFQYIKMDGS